MSKFRCGQGAAEEKALTFGTIMGLKEGELCLRFDALGNDALLEVLAHINNGAHDGRVIGIGGDLTNKGLINFQDINGKLAKIAQARITGAKVIHGQVYAYVFEVMQNGASGFGIRHEDAFCEFQVETAGIQAGFRQRSRDTFDKVLVAKFGGRNVNGDALEWEARCLPFARLSACFAQHPAANHENEATI